MYQEIFKEIIQQLKSIAEGVNNPWTVWVSLLGVFVALLLGVMGIFQNWLRKKIWKPELEIGFRLSPPDSHKIPMKMINISTGAFLYEYNTYYIRARVKNSGNYQLEDAEVMAIELTQKEPNNQFKKINNFLPLNFRWANTHEITKSKIQPELFKFLDFGHISEVKNENVDNFNLSTDKKVVLVLDVEVAPNTGSHLIFPGEYRIKLIFAANNMSSVTKIYSLIISDKWSNNQEEMLGSNIFIKEEKSMY